jgi:hypothetical protein
MGGADCGGICLPDIIVCPLILCEEGSCENGFANGPDGCPTCACEPDPEPEPCHIGGCSSELCVGPDDPDISICIEQPWTECLALTQCGNFGLEGSCGWEHNDDFIECLATHGL